MAEEYKVQTIESGIHAHQDAEMTLYLNHMAAEGWHYHSAATNDSMSIVRLVHVRHTPDPEDDDVAHQQRLETERFMRENASAQADAMVEVLRKMGVVYDPRPTPVK